MKTINLITILICFIALTKMNAQVVKYEEYKMNVKLENLNDKESHYIAKAVGLDMFQIDKVKTINYERLRKKFESKDAQAKEKIDNEYFQQIEAMLNDIQRRNWQQAKEELKKIDDEIH
jgi:ABC-type phosphate transport system auxiliary subunit